jgi:hypothetical protein
MPPCFPHQLKNVEFSDSEKADILNYLRANYIEAGQSPTGAIHGTAMDLGLRPEWVAKMFNENRVIRRTADDVCARQSRSRSAITEAKAIIRNLDVPNYKQFIRAIYNTPFSVAVFGHGTVGMQTHAGAKLFSPPAWNSYFRNFVRQFQYMKPAFHEKAMQDLVNDAAYTPAKRAGLAVDPARVHRLRNIRQNLWPDCD